jgi:hypothetical protein
VPAGNSPRTSLPPLVTHCAVTTCYRLGFGRSPGRQVRRAPRFREGKCGFSRGRAAELTRKRAPVPVTAGTIVPPNVSKRARLLPDRRAAGSIAAASGPLAPGIGRLANWRVKRHVPFHAPERAHQNWFLSGPGRAAARTICAGPTKFQSMGTRGKARRGQLADGGHHDPIL